MNLEQRIVAFSQLGQFMSQFASSKKLESCNELNELYYDKVDNVIWSCKHHNGWFDRDSVIQGVTAIANKLTATKLNEWLTNYEIKQNSPKNVMVIMAGNIPLVGFDDCLAVLITGNTFVGKLSSKDDKLLVALLDVLVYIEPDFTYRIIITTDFAKNIDAVIATGSNNSARYFDSYFGKYPHIIRKNRNSVAVLTGNETKNELEEFGYDIFKYYGLGCRNVSKLFLPKNYNFDLFFEALKPFETVFDTVKYANNYIYNKSLLEIGKEPYIDNGFLILKQHSSMTSPVAMLYYDFYENIEVIEKEILEQKEQIQCVISSGLKNSIPFGMGQQPELNDYADGVDTLEFLLKL